MKINVYFGSGGYGLYFDAQKPLDQVKTIQSFIESNIDFDVNTFSPYIIEAIDSYSNEIEIHYFNNGVEVDIMNILNEISEAFYMIQDKKDGKTIPKSTNTINIKNELNKWLEIQSLWFENTKKMLNK